MGRAGGWGRPLFYLQKRPKNWVYTKSMAPYGTLGSSNSNPNIWIPILVWDFDLSGRFPFDPHSVSAAYLTIAESTLSFLSMSGTYIGTVNL